MNTETIKNTIQAVIDGLTPLAQKLAVPLEKIFEWAVRENYITAIMSGVWLIMSIILSVMLVKFLKYAWKKYLEDKYSMWDFRFYMVGIIGVSTIIFIFLVSFNSIVSRLVNPEYHALIDIVDMVKPSSCNK
jgi:hypothetical protein